MHTKVSKTQFSCYCIVICASKVLVNGIMQQNSYMLCAGQIVLPPPPPGVREKVYVIKKGGVVKNEVKKGRTTGK